MNHGSLFSGIGGFDLAAEWLNLKNIFHCEIEPFGRKVLNHYWPESISYEDITTTDFTVHRNQIDILTGGFPCQGFSVAGNRHGTEDHRYLWPEMLRAAKQIKPTWIIAENVTGILSMEDKSFSGKEVFLKVESSRVTRLQSIDDYEKIYTRQAKMLVSTICENLEKERYEVQPIVIPAASVGAPHRRARIWIIAHCTNPGIETLQKREDRVLSNKVTTNSNNDGLSFAKVRQSNCKGNSYNQTWPNTAKQSQRCSCTTDVANTSSFGGNQSQCRESSEQFDENVKETGTSTNCESLKIHDFKFKTNSYGERKTRECNCKYVSSNASNKRLQGNQRCKEHGKTVADEQKGMAGTTSKLFTRPNWEKFPTQSPICLGDDGLSDQLDGITFSKWRQESIKGAGNAIVPQVAYEILKNIVKVQYSKI